MFIRSIYIYIDSIFNKKKSKIFNDNIKALLPNYTFQPISKEI